ncbi:MAG: hypothetical protein M0R73_04485 [Dehalococcoidia bacterium]|nr:hypothetical protein [Dehalococcoidia bacterium]
MNTPMGSRDLTLKLDSSGGGLAGQVESAQGTQTITNGSTDGDSAKWDVEMSGPMGAMTLSYAGQVEGDAITGTVQFGAFGSGDFSGARG